MAAKDVHDLLNRWRPQLVTKLGGRPELLDELLANGVINYEEMTNITHEKTPQEQARMMLHVLRRKDFLLFGKFLEVLCMEKIGEHELAKLIQGDMKGSSENISKQSMSGQQITSGCDSGQPITDQNLLVSKHDIEAIHQNKTKDISEYAVQGDKTQEKDMIDCKCEDQQKEPSRLEDLLFNMEIQQKNSQIELDLLKEQNNTLKLENKSLKEENSSLSETIREYQNTIETLIEQRNADNILTACDGNIDKDTGNLYEKDATLPREPQESKTPVQFPGDKERGPFIWKITDVSGKAQRCEQVVSEVFEVSGGYRFRLMGMMMTTGWPDNVPTISLFGQLMPGSDPALVYPFRKKVNFTLLDASGGQNHRIFTLPENAVDIWYYDRTVFDYPGAEGSSWIVIPEPSPLLWSHLGQNNPLISFPSLSKPWTLTPPYVKNDTVTFTVES